MAQTEAIEKFECEQDVNPTPWTQGYASIYWSVNHQALIRDKDGLYLRVMTQHELNSTIEKVNGYFAQVNEMLKKQEDMIEGWKDGAVEVLRREIGETMEAKQNSLIAQTKERIVADLQLDANLARHSSAQETKLQQLKSELQAEIADMQVDTKLADHQAMMGSKFEEVKQNALAELQLDARLAEIKKEQEAKLQQLQSELDTKIVDVQLDSKLADHHANMGAKMAEMKEHTVTDLQLDAKLANLSTVQEDHLQQFKSELDGKLASMQLDDKLTDYQATMDAKMAEMKASILTDPQLDAKLAILSTAYEEKLEQFKSESDSKVANMQLDAKLADHQVTMGEKFVEMKQSVITDLQLDAKLASFSTVQEEALQKFKSELESKIADMKLDGRHADHQATMGTESVQSGDESPAELHFEAKLAGLVTAQEEKLKQFKSEFDRKIASMQLDGKLADWRATRDASPADMQLVAGLTDEEVVHKEELQQFMSEIDIKIAKMRDDFAVLDERSIFCFRS